MVDDVQTNLRLPSDLKSRLTAAAERNHRSLSAEVAARLSRSFEPAPTEVDQLVDAEIARASSEGSSIGLRLELARSRGERLISEARLAALEAESAAAKAKTDADFEALERRFTAENERIGAEQLQIERDIAALEQQRAETLQRLQALHDAVSERRDLLLKAVADYIARRKADS